MVLQYRNVPNENVEEFVYRETTYWSKVAKQAIKDGKMLSWALWQKVGGWEMPGSSNFFFVNVFEKASDLDDIGGAFDASKVFPDVRMTDMETNNLSTVNHQIILQGLGGAGEGSPQFVVLNYAKASNLERYLELEQTVWQPFIQAQMDAGKTKQKIWRLASLILPNGTDLPFNAITVDGYDKLSDAIGQSFSEGVEMPDFTEFGEVHEKVYIQVYSLVKEVR